jgi:uracil-DNA glycosylase
MTIFEKIKEEIMADSMNEPYTKKGIPPLFYATKEARLVVVGQAPGRKAEESRIFWNDASGDRLREWMGISREVFYGSENIAQLPRQGIQEKPNRNRKKLPRPFAQVPTPSPSITIKF